MHCVRQVLVGTVPFLLALLWTGCSPSQPKTQSREAAASPRSAPPATETQTETDKEASLVITGKVVKVSAVPQPGAAPYTQCLTYIKYQVLSVDSGHYEGKELLAVYWGMRDNKLMPAAAFKVGEVHKMKLEPFSRHPELQRVMAADDTDEYELTPYWVVK